MTQPVGTALARKLSASQEERGDKPRSVLRALRLAFARAAGDVMQLPLTVIGAKQSCRPADTLAEIAKDDWLFVLLGNGDGVSAAVCLDPGAVSAIVQVQTFGQVMSDPPSARVCTDTDAAMVAPLIEEVLTRASRIVESSGDQAGLTGYEYKARLPDKRTLTLAMVEDIYDVYELTVELGGGVRQGQISVFLPDRQKDGDLDAPEEQVAGPNLEQSSGVLRAELNTVICRMSLPFASLSGLSEGDVLPLVGARVDKAEVLTIDRSRAAVGRLGQCGGMRAVRLNEHETIPSPLNAAEHEFLEARSPTAQSKPEHDLETDIVPITPKALETIEGELTLGDSDQIAAEISKLAGLDDKPD
jgi:flagellar motor switch protein FliM